MSFFWETLFEPNENICLASNVYETELYNVELCVEYGIPKSMQFFAINPLQTSRKDSNVTVFRNILLEFDQGSREEQLKQLEGVPYSTLVWSGGKSHHAIISLKTPCVDRREYDTIIRHIYAKLPMADKSVKNPSRLSRVPGSIRDNGKLQELLEVRGQINTEQLSTWLGPLPEKPKSEGPKLKSLHLSPWTKYFLLFGAEPGQRNSSLFKAACDMLRHGYTQEAIVERVQEVLDLPVYEIRSCVASAATAVRRGN